MDRVLYSSPHIPRQWIAAHCMEPHLLHPSGDFVHECVERVEGLCTYARAWISSALADRHAAGIVLAMTCDQMRRAFEILSEHALVPCFLFNIPATWQTVQARRLYRDEIRRLGRFLVGLGGRALSAKDLADQMLKNENIVACDKATCKSGKIPLALIGPHGMADDTVWMDMIAQADGEVLMDCSSPAHPVFDRRTLMQDPFSELADACFDAIQDLFQRPNSGFFLKLDRALRQSNARGLIVRRYLWCDVWHAEIHRLKKWAPVPVLDLEISDRPKEDSHRLCMRIQSFMEIMK
jgi:benzoyl-CoA reductase/2-hydroxyglutaryl-CoA dehydratase subunit BcrC/BadD/HgdB